ncbi:MAG: hypothetical protein KBF17_06050 [Candidatus Promineofilum sp.]|nr:hypothetical protein [Promineifilum sp.]MBP9656893.1 hypothetical protein [Promineifilum sp.]
MILVILKLLVVLIFLVMFIRRPSVVWGIGLLTVTTAVLLDTLLGTFNREELLADLGFFFYVISGVLLAGAATWFWGVVRPLLPGGTLLPAGQLAPATPVAHSANVPPASKSPSTLTPKVPPPLPPGHVDDYEQAGYDRQMLFEEIRGRFSREDLSDLMFDLEVNELDVTTAGQTTDELIIRIMDTADRDGKASIVGLAVERILTPPPPKHLPRLAKLTEESPHTVIRHYLLAHYNAEQLEELATRLNVDWEQLEGTDKKARTRAFLSYLYRRGRISDLLAAMRAGTIGKTAG